MRCLVELERWVGEGKKPHLGWSTGRNKRDGVISDASRRLRPVFD